MNTLPRYTYQLLFANRDGSPEVFEHTTEADAHAYFASFGIEDADIYSAIISNRGGSAMEHRIWMDTEAHRIITEEELYAEYTQRPEEMKDMAFEDYIVWGEEFTLRRII